MLKLPEIFPNLSENEIKKEYITKDKINPSFRLFGLRFIKDQTVVEYLVEFLLVFTSPKGLNRDSENSLSIILDNNERLFYYPPTLLPIKFFTFFAESKLETRHKLHSEIFRQKLNSLKENINLEEDYGKVEEIVRILQGLFYGFVGTPGRRTWCAHTFLPISTSLIGREVMWENVAAKRADIKTWGDSKKFFSTSSHSFLARGGELLYLQLLNLFNNSGNKTISELKEKENYKTYLSGCDIIELKNSLEEGLINLLKYYDKQIKLLSEFIELAFSKEDLDLKETKAECTWIPSQYLNESLLFAWEMNNLLKAQLEPLQKIELLQLLCALQVLRSMCFQASRYVENPLNINGFVGNYYWIVSSSDGEDTKIKKISIQNYSKIEQLIYRAISVIDNLLREDLEKKYLFTVNNLNERYGHGLFRKLAKEIGLVIPKNGKNMRFTLNKDLIRLLVISLIPPEDNKISLSSFMKRIYLHYGIVLEDKIMGDAIHWTLPELDNKFSCKEPKWFINSLKAGGFLIPLSDSISIVQNPFKK